MHLIYRVACAALLTASIQTLAEGVDLAKSKVMWKGSKVVGSFHEGTVDLKSADLKFKDGEPVSGKVVIDMTTIKDTDLTDPSWNKKLVDHLKNEDFFDVQKHKTAELRIKKIQKASEKFYMIMGDLVIKGKSQPVNVKAEVAKTEGDSQTVKANFKFDRTKYGIKYGSGSFFEGLGDKMIADEVEISVELAVTADKKKMASN